MNNRVIGQYHFFVQNGIFYEDLSIYLRVIDSGSNKAFIAAPTTWKEVGSFNTIQPEPWLKIERGQAQHLMDQLWVAGLRPVQGLGSAGQLAAIERHLEDMRSLVFNKDKK